MRENQITVFTPRISGFAIEYSYEIKGNWIEAFSSIRSFKMEYDFDVSIVPEGVAIVPLLANLLPIAWVYDADVIAPICDADFYNCIPKVKKGYESMYPMLKLGGSLKVGEIQENDGDREGAICLFSGGVDAFSTLIHHINERPLLFTLHGSDVDLDDIEGWHNVESHVGAVADEFGVGRAFVASGFRLFLNETVLSEKVAVSGDNWWHGFQHGLGILGHAAPIAWVYGKKTVYIASSFTAAEKGKVTCASDPSIDNNVCFCGASVVHDGYDLRRQDKVNYIVAYSRERRVPISLRVCWESRGGSNCCHCEKCLRTLLAVYAEGANPCDYGFEYDDIDELGESYRKRFRFLGGEEWLMLRYSPIQEAMRANYSSSEDVTSGFRWFYEGDLREMAHAFSVERLIYRVMRKVRTLLSWPSGD